MSIPGFEGGSTTVNGVEIIYEMGGEGPPLLMLHGFPQNRSMWTHVAPKLAEHYTVVCADLRGYGDSGKPKCLPDNSNYAFRALADDQFALMQHLGFQQFHLVGHDRGGRTAHRLALDHPAAVTALTVMDIAPTYTMFMNTNHVMAGTYWHWYFLQQPAPFPERMIEHDPDFFYETCLLSWGASGVSDFDQDMLDSYRRSWRDPGMIHGSCSDYRAAATIDLEHDHIDLERQVECPTLVLYGANGQVGKMFDIPAEWAKCCSNMTAKTLPAGHFFVDQLPDQTTGVLLEFLRQSR
ncbi:MAG: alpha/beta hydrolase [Alcaligenaceae bacterium]|nr:alpha/beta hydrolase [Alcaligenaceae bacterium]